MKKSVVVEFRWGNNSKDVEVPLNITCDELIHALNSGIGLGINERDTQSYKLIASNPHIYIEGEKTIEEIGLLDGAILTLQEFLLDGFDATTKSDYYKKCMGDK